MRTAAVVTTMVLVAFAGCAEDDASSKATAATTAPAAVVTEDTGSIQGLVLDAESVPLAGAQVLLLPEKNATQTDASGAFTYNNVQPGPKTLVASHLGYEETQLKIDVVVGEVNKPKLTLTALRIQDPHVVVHSGALYLNLAFNDLHRAGFLDGISCSPCEYWWHTQPGVTDGILEVIWKPSVTGPMINEVFNFGLSVNAKNSSIGGQDFLAGGDRIWSGNLRSREHFAFEPENAEKFPTKETVTMVHANTPDVNFGIQQRIDLWMTLAYDTLLAEDYTVLPPP